MRRAKTLALAAAISVAGSAAAFADSDVPGPDWLPKEQVIQKLESAGYSNVTGVHADDGYWEGKGVKDGKIMEFEADPRSGAIIKEKIDTD
jgi:hypothetical protein